MLLSSWSQNSCCSSRYHNHVQGEKEESRSFPMSLLQTFLYMSHMSQICHVVTFNYLCSGNSRQEVSGNLCWSSQRTVSEGPLWGILEIEILLKTEEDLEPRSRHASSHLKTFLLCLEVPLPSPHLVNPYLCISSSLPQPFIGRAEPLTLSWPGQTPYGPLGCRAPLLGSIGHICSFTVSFKRSFESQSSLLLDRKLYKGPTWPHLSPGLGMQWH